MMPRVSLNGECGAVEDAGHSIVALQHDHCDDPYDAHSRLVVGDEEYSEVRQGQSGIFLRVSVARQE